MDLPILVPLLDEPDQRLRAWAFQEYGDPQQTADETIKALDKIVAWIKTGVVPAEKPAPRKLKVVESDGPTK
jgi:hypothetical protein